MQDRPQAISHTISSLGRAVRVAGWYLLAGVLWISFSDYLVWKMAPADLQSEIQTYKGWGFVAVTGAILFVSVLRALRAQEEAAETIGKQQSKFRTYIENAPMAVFVLDSRGRCVEANQQAADLVGCDLPTLFTLNVADFAPPGEDRVVGEVAMATLTAQRWIEGDFRLLRQDGRSIWIHARVAGLGDQQFIGCAYDMTSQKEDEERLRQAGAVFRSTREGVVVTDSSGRIVTVNPAFTEITGYEESEVVGRNPRFLKSGVQDRDWYRDMWRAIHEAGYWQGEIWNRRKSGEIYPEWLTISSVRDARGEAVNYVGVFTDISRIKHSEAQLDHLAHTDALTGLANRLLLDSRLEHALARAVRTGRRVAVAALDIDGFHRVNEVLGLETGDAVVRAVGGRLQSLLETSDTLARLGGDEFVVVREDLPGTPAAADLARTLLDAFAQPIITAGGRPLHLSVSIGVSLCPDDAISAAELMKQAGAAVRHVKSAGGKAFCFHTASMEHAAKSRFALEDDLRRAMDARELVLYFQPRVALISGRIEGAEALVRWRASDGTIKEPDDFIGVAEASGLIQPLGRWVLEEACRQQVAWLAAGLDVRTIAVNVSPVQLRDTGFVDHVAATLAASGVDPSRIELEITESATLDPGAHIDERLQQLAALGTRIAIDDFGTGYSSLSHLTRLPVHTIKIDRSFLKALPATGTGREVVATIVSMATHLGLETVGEGVETEAEATFLRRCGCKLGQGFLFGKPMRAEEFTALVVGAR